MSVSLGEVRLKAVVVREIKWGWYLRGRSISGWRLVLHRILWGFDGLTNYGDGNPYSALVYEWKADQ